MEWMLQVVDELDDVVGTLRLCCLGVEAEISLGMAGAAAFGAIAAALSAGAEPLLIAAMSTLLGLAALLKARAARAPATI